MMKETQEGLIVGFPGGRKYNGREMMQRISSDPNLAHLTYISSVLEYISPMLIPSMFIIFGQLRGSLVSNFG